MRHAVITGGSRRLGLYLTEGLLKDDWHVTVLTRSVSPELAAITNPQLSVILVDYFDITQLLALCAPLLEQPIDLLIHNASIFAPDSDVDKNPNLFAQLFQIHMQLPTLLNDLLLPSLQQSVNPNIIHMTDIYAANPRQDYSLYCASKAGLESLSKSYAKKLSPKIRVNSIAPGPLKFLPSHSEESKKEVLESTLIPVEAGFEPIYTTVQYIMNNTFLTGTCITVDGGRTLGRN